MPANTPKGYPYPVGTDRLMDGDDAIHNLATFADTNVGVVAAGSVVVATPASGAGTAPVTFPAGRFTTAPFVTATLVGSGSVISAGVPTVTGVSTTGCTVSYNRGATGNFTVHWIAVQV